MFMLFKTLSLTALVDEEGRLRIEILVTLRKSKRLKQIVMKHWLLAMIEILSRQMVDSCGVIDCSSCALMPAESVQECKCESALRHGRWQIAVM